HPFWAKAEELGVLIFIHPQSTPDLARRFKGNGWLANTIGNPLDTTIALSHLIFEGTLDRFPGLKICSAHGGGYLPSYAPRSDNSLRVAPDMDTGVKLKKKPTEYLRTMYYDTLVFTSEALRHLAAEVGTSQLVVGTDHPIPWQDKSVDHILKAPGFSNAGAPLVGQERLTDPRTIARAVTMMEEYLGRRFRAIMSLEIGGGNAVQPFMAAALLDRPVVDADCMGRAFPEAQMTSFAIHDLRMYPLMLVDVRDNAVIVAQAASWKWMERLSRTACVAVGSIAATCKAPRTGKEVKDCGILYSTSKAIGLGQTVQAARHAHRDPIEAIVEAERGQRLFAGKIADVARRATEGFLRGTARIDGLGDCRGQRFELAFQNEFAVGWLDGTPRV